MIKIPKPSILLWIAPFVLLAPVIFGGKALFWGTPATQFVPWWSWAWDTLLSGHLPLWNPLVGMGAPLIANYQSGLFYPPYWLCFIFYGIGGISAMAWGQAVVMALHWAWAGWGMTKLVRRFGMGEHAQIICGLAFGLSGGVVARSIFPSITAAVVWMPWILTSAYDVAVAPKFEKVIRLGVLIGLQLLAGHAQTAWYSLAFMVIWAAFWAWNAQEKKNRLKRVISTWLWMGLAIALGLALSAIQTLPTAEYLLQSQRSVEVGYELALTNSFWPWRFLGFLTPELFGSPVQGDFWGYATYWEDAVYIGLIPVLLALGVMLRGLFKPKSLERKQVSKSTVGGLRPVIIFLTSVIFGAFLFALGKYTPVYPWLYANIPTFDMFKSPTRLSIVAVIAVVILAGFGVERWRRPEGRALYWSRLGTMGAFAVALGAGLGWIFLSEAIPDFRISYIRGIALAGFWGLGFGALSLTAPKKGVANPSVRWRWAVALWVAADLIVAGWGMNPGVELDFYATPYPSSPVLISDLGDGRLYFDLDDEDQIKYEQYFRFDSFTPLRGWGSLRAILIPNLNMLDRIPMVNNYDPLQPGRYARWMDELSDLDIAHREPLFDLMGISIYERESLTGNFGVEFVPRATAARVRWVPCSVAAKNPDSALALAFSGQIDFDAEVILENAYSSQSQGCQSRTGSVQIVSEHPNQVILDVESDFPGWLLLSDVNYPGWRAWVDGQPASIYSANYLFRAVAVPAGEHQVKFAYRPISFYAGAGITLVALLGLGGFAIYGNLIYDRRNGLTNLE